MGAASLALVGQLLRSPAAPTVVACHQCGAETDSPPLGLPTGWDGVFRHASGWIFTCPTCFERRFPMLDEEIEILDRLCAYRADGAVFKSLKHRLPNGIRRAIQRLRYRGLVALNGYRPSDSAMTAWRARRAVLLATVSEIASAAGGPEDHSLPPADPASEAATSPADVPPAGGVAAVPSSRAARGWPADRQDLFLATLRETRNLKEALAAVGLCPNSRQNAYRERKRCPEFARRWAEIAAESEGPWSASRRAAFLDALKETGSVKGALESIGLSRESRKVVYRIRRDDADFAAAWDRIVAERKPIKRTEAADQATAIEPVAEEPHSPPQTSQRPLSARSTAVLHRLERAAEEGAAAPTNSELCDAFGWLSNATVTDALKDLQTRGLIRIARNGKWRRITIAATGKTTADPVAPVAQALAPKPAAGEAYQSRLPEDGIDWELARQRQQQRRSAATKLSRTGSAKSIKGAGAGTYFLARQVEQNLANQERLADPVEQARTALQRRGRVVYRMSVHGGSAELWFCSGLGKNVTDADIVAEAERLAG